MSAAFRLFGALLLAMLLAACPKDGGVRGVGPGSGHPDKSVSATPTPPPAWAPEARMLLGIALGAGRLAWTDPEIRPGERLRWRVAATAVPDLVIEVRRSEPGSTPGTENWSISTTSTPKKEIDLVLEPARAKALRVAWRDGSGKEVVLTRDEDLAAVFPAAIVADEPGFIAAGGTFVGNEVVRVPAGEFRARHAVIARDGGTWHYYIARSVPGGVVKLELFAEGANDPSTVIELDDFTRLARPVEPPAP